MASLSLRGKLTICCIVGQLLSPVHTLPLQAEETGSASTTQGPVVLQEKTRGNLSPPEEHLIESLLYDLRLRYVELSKLAAVDLKP